MNTNYDPFWDEMLGIRYEDGRDLWLAANAADKFSNKQYDEIAEEELDCLIARLQAIRLNRAVEEAEANQTALPF